VRLVIFMRRGWTSSAYHHRNSGIGNASVLGAGRASSPRRAEVLRAHSNQSMSALHTRLGKMRRRARRIWRLRHSSRVREWGREMAERDRGYIKRRSMRWPRCSLLSGGNAPPPEFCLFSSSHFTLVSLVLRRLCASHFLSFYDGNLPLCSKCARHAVSSPSPVVTSHTSPL
jgi:hypothetical protein